MYNKDNIFYKILKNQIPANIISKTKHSLCFYDAFPVYKVHAIVIPKGEYIDFYDFIQNASKEEQNDFFTLVNTAVDELKIKEKGFRVLSNIGKNAKQEIKHFHMHIIGGEMLKDI